MYDDASANVLLMEMLFIHYKMAPITGAKSPLGLIFYIMYKLHLISFF